MAGKKTLAELLTSETIVPRPPGNEAMVRALLPGSSSSILSERVMPDRGMSAYERFQSVGTPAGGLEMAANILGPRMGGRIPRIGNLEPSPAANSSASRPAPVSDQYPELDEIFRGIRNQMATEALPIPRQNPANFNPAPPPAPRTHRDAMQQLFMTEQGLSPEMLLAAPAAFRQKIEGDFERWLAANVARSQFKIIE